MRTVYVMTTMCDQKYYLKCIIRNTQIHNTLRESVFGSLSLSLSLGVCAISVVELLTDTPVQSDKEVKL